MRDAGPAGSLNLLSTRDEDHTQGLEARVLQVWSCLVARLLLDPKFIFFSTLKGL